LAGEETIQQRNQRDGVEVGQKIKELAVIGSKDFEYSKQQPVVT
jgi:hypothetical protein